MEQLYLVVLKLLDFEYSRFNGFNLMIDKLDRTSAIITFIDGLGKKYTFIISWVDSRILFGHLEYKMNSQELLTIKEKAHDQAKKLDYNVLLYINNMISSKDLDT